MIRSLDGKVYNVDTPHEKAAYTKAVIRHNKIKRERKKEKEADSVTNRLKSRFVKRGQV